MQEWYLMTSNTKPNLLGGYENDTYLQYKDDALTEVLQTDIATTITLYSSDLSKSIIVRSIVQNKVADTNERSTERQCLFQIGTSKEYIYAYFENNYWLITSYVGNNGIYEKAIVKLCTYQLKFQHPVTGAILSYPCIDETTSSVGIDKNNTISTLNNIHHIKLPFDDSTKLIKIDDRFFLDRVGTTTYKTTVVNNTEFNYGSKGLIELTLQADGAYNPNTDMNGVCNYHEPTPPPTPTPTGYTLTISSSGDFNLGTTRTLTPTLKDGSGNDVIIDSASWVVDYGGMTQSWFVVRDIPDNKYEVKILDDAFDCIDLVLKLTCTVTYTVGGNTSTVSGVYSGTITAN